MSIRKKRNILSLIGLIIILVLGPLAYFRFIRPKLATASWFDDKFYFRTAITITNSGSADANKKVKFDIDTATLYSAGKIKINCDDSRFTDTNGKLLQYYLDSANGACNTASTDYYVLIPTINAGTTTIYHYYGNPSATKGSENAQFSQATFSQDATSTSTEEQSKAPVAYWSFDEGYGATTSDSSSSRNNGTITGAVWKSEDLCVSGKCLYFDGSADNVSISSSIILAPNPGFTFSHWLRTASTGGQVYTLGNAGGGNGYRFGISAGKVAFLIGSVSGGYSEKTCGTTTVNDNKWHLITGVFGSASLTCYIDGRLEATVAYDLGEDYTGMSTSAPGIGAPPCCTDFQGFIDNVKIYPYQRTAAQVKSDYNAGKKGMGTNKGSSVNLGGNAQQSEAFSEGLVGYWKMDENTGTTTTDSSGNLNTGVLGAGTSAPGWVAGMYGIGLSFDGSSDYVNVGNSASLNSLTSMTISAWINIGSTSSSYRSGIVSRRNDSGGLNFDVSGSLESSCGAGKIEVMEAGAANVCGTTTLSVGTWYHAVAVLENTNVKLYLNGTPDGSGTLTWNWDSSTNIFLGNINNNPAYFFNGKMDEVRIYNRALSPAEVRQLYDWAPGPVGYWKMEEGSGATTNDSSTFANTGVVGTGVSAPTWATGKYGKGLHFDGSGSKDVLTVTDNSGLGPPTMTVEAWVYPTAFVSGASIYNRRDSGNVGGTTLELNGTGGSVLCYYYISSAWRSAATTATLSLSRWNHISCTYDGSTIVLYINGVKDATTTSIAGTVNNPASPSVTIGRNIANNTLSWAGTIDEVKIYNYARSAKQIVEDMNAGHPAPGSPVGSAFGYWKFDEGYGTTANNSGNSSSTLNGSLTGSTAPTWSNNGQFGKALSFLSGYVQTSATTLGTSFSYSVWFKPSSFVAWAAVLTNLKHSAPASGLNIIPQSGSIRICYGDGVNGYAYYNVIADEVVLNSWNHAVVTYDGTTVSLYINGKLKDNRNITVSQSSQTIRIGIWASSYAGYLFDGLIDEVKVYQLALSADEVKLEYNHGSALVLGSTSVNTGNTAPATAGSQEYCVPGDTAACSPPVAEWKMEEGSGTSANDSSTYGNTGTLGTGNSAPTWTAGKYGKGLSFDGSRNFVNVGSSSSLNPGNDITLSAWVYWNGGTGDRNIVTKESAYEFRVNGGYINYAINPWAWRGGTDAPISPNKWQYVVVTNDSDGLQKIYIDGVEKHSESSGGAITSNSNVVTIGARYAGAGSFFGGFIDEAKIYNYARTPAQIAWDYNRGGPVGHWKFDECQGTTVNDSSGNNNTGTITIGIGASGSQNTAGTCNSGVGSSAAWGNGSSGKFNSSLNLDGADDYVTLSNNSPLDVLGSAANPVTLSVWIKPNDNSGYKVFFTKGRYVALYNSTTPVIFLYDPSELYPPAANPNYWFWGSASATIGSWNNVVFTFDGTVVSWYVNGNLNTSASLPGIQVGWSGTAYLGKTYTGDPAEYTNGQIDEVQVYNYALSATQIKDIYNQGSAIRFGPLTGSP